MIYLNQNQLNQVPATCSRNGFLMDPDYLWVVTHKLTGRVWRFIPYRIPPSTDYKPGYDLFCINVSETLPEVLTGSTSCSNTSTLNLYPGEYFIKIYEQYSESNLIPGEADDIVYETIMWVVGVNQNQPITYSGNSDIFIVYNENND
jgi:hypothetical protein